MADAAAKSPNIARTGRCVTALLLIVALSLALTACWKSTPLSTDASYRSAPQELRAASWQSELPADVVLAIDQSGSMSTGIAPTDPHGLRVEGSRAFLEFVAARSTKDLQNRFGVINFGTTAPTEVAVPLAEVSAESEDALRELRGGIKALQLGDTNFRAALERASELFGSGSTSTGLRNKAVVVFTDGEPDDPHHLPQKEYFEEISRVYTDLLKPNGVIIFVVGIDAVGKRWSASVPFWREVIGDDHVFTASSMEALKGEFNRIVQRIWHLPEVAPIHLAGAQPAEFDVEPYLEAVEFHVFPDEQGLKLDIYRPDGAVLKPGRDNDTPEVKHLANFDRIVVNQPAPGRWRYEVVGSGHVEVLRNPIPLRLQLISPDRVHPQGKPMRFVAEFRRADGRPVSPHPDYPLGLSADVRTPEGALTAVKFLLGDGRNGIYPADQDFLATETVGDYNVTLKVTGGGKYHSKQDIPVEVRRLPYLEVNEPTEGTVLDRKDAVHVKAHLLVGGKPARSKELFSNHPDQLVLAQIISTPGGRRGPAVWLNSVSTNPGAFEGIVPSPETAEGSYQLALNLAPEDPKSSLADQTVSTFREQRPLWVSDAARRLPRPWRQQRSS
jgi:Mg-chelatase subunit ChlD